VYYYNFKASEYPACGGCAPNRAVREQYRYRNTSEVNEFVLEGNVGKGLDVVGWLENGLSVDNSPVLQPLFLLIFLAASAQLACTACGLSFFE
jgi:hypothetical protein